MRSSLSVIFMVFLFLNPLQAQDKFLLEYKYEKGKSYKYQQDSKFESVLEVSGQEMKNVGNTISVSRIDVQDVLGNGDQAVTLTYDDFRIVTKMGTFDTTIVMKDMLGKGSRVIISRFGDVVESGKIDVADTAKGNGSSDIGSADLSKELVRFPDHPVGIGETWNEEKQDTASGTSLVTSTRIRYVLEKEEIKNDHSCLKITFTGTLEISGKMNQMGMEFFMEGTRETSGSLWFDKNIGIIIAKENLTEQDMTMAMTGQMQMTIPMTNTITGNFHLIE